MRRNTNHAFHYAGEATRESALQMKNKVEVFTAAPLWQEEIEEIIDLINSNLKIENRKEGK